MIGSRVQWRWLGAAALGVAATLGACVIDGGPGPAATELYALIDAHCRSATTCDCVWAQADEDACTEELEARWKARLSEAQARDLRYDAECFASLAAEIEARGCYWPGGSVPLCGSFCAVFHGDRAEGDGCEGDDGHVSDCAQGLVCVQGTCASPCAGLSGRARGEPCASENQGIYDDCAAGLWCSWQSGVCELAAAQGQPCRGGACGEGLTCFWETGVCERAPTEGQRCDDLNCADGLYCDWNFDGAYCRAYAGQGESCNDGACDEGLWCNESRVCVGAPGAGQPCLYGSICAEGTVCDFDDTVCRAAPEEGRPCIQGTCARGSWCDTAEVPEGICAPLQANDEMCSGHRQCQSNYCPNGFCWALPVEGDHCEGAGVCASGLVCNGTTCEPTLARAPAACSYPGW